MDRRFRIMAIVAFAACAGRAGDLIPPGQESGPCYGNDTCNADLSCSASGLCVRPGPATHEGCGNGQFDSGEACEDGNLDDGDGCSSVCVVEDQGPGGDLCLDARRLRLASSAPNQWVAYATGDTTGGTDTLNCTCSCVGPEQVFVVAVPDGGSVFATMSPEGFDSAIHLRGPGAAGCIDSTAEIDCGENDGTSGPEQVEARELAAGDYYIIPDGWSGGSGAYTLQVAVRID